MSLALDAAIVIAYFVIGIRLTTRAYAYLVDPSKDQWYTPIFEPGKFKAEGQASRRQAIQFWNWGGLALIVYLFFL